MTIKEINTIWAAIYEYLRSSFRIGKVEGCWLTMIRGKSSKKYANINKLLAKE